MAINVYNYTLSNDGDVDLWNITDSYSPFISYVKQSDTYDTLCQRLETGNKKNLLLLLIISYYYELLLL